MAAGDSATIELDGHRLALTHLRKVLYPATGTTKSDIIAYFAEVAHAMMPHLAGRPGDPQTLAGRRHHRAVLPQGPAEGHADLGDQAGDHAFGRPEGVSAGRFAGHAGLAGSDRRPGTACAAVAVSGPSAVRVRGRTQRNQFRRRASRPAGVRPRPGTRCGAGAVRRGGPRRAGPAGRRGGPGHQRLQGHSPVQPARRDPDLRRRLGARPGGRRGHRAGDARPGGVPDGKGAAGQESLHRLVAEQRIEDHHRAVLVARPGPSDRRRAADLGGTGRPGPAAPGVHRGAGTAVAGAGSDAGPGDR